MLSNQNGLSVVLPGAKIYVCAAAATVNFANTPPCTTVSAYSDPLLTMLQTQPFVADGNGNFTLYAAACVTYTIAFTSPSATGYSKQWTAPCVNASNPTFNNLTVSGTSTGCISVNLSGNLAFTGNNTHSGTETFNNTITSNSGITLGPSGAVFSGTTATFNSGAIFNGAGITDNATLVASSGGTMSGAFTHSGTETFKYLQGRRLADSFAGADCGAKINAAEADLGATPGVITFTAAGCGNITTAVTISNNAHVIQADCGTYNLSALITISGQGSGLTGVVSSGESDGSSPNFQGCVSIIQANNANLSPMIKETGARAFLTNILIDGNKFNNPTAGPCVIHTFPVSGTNAARQYEKDVTIQKCKGDGAQVLSTVAGALNEAGATEFDHVMLIANDMDGLYVSGTFDVWIRNGSQSENNGINTGNGGAYGGAYTQVTMSGTSVTWTSGEKWTTDASMIGRHVSINNCRTTVATVPSTTTMTISSTTGTQNSASCTISNGSGQPLRMGHGIEWSDCQGCRSIGNDVGGNELDGHICYGTTAVGCSDGLIFNNQFGGNVENDLEIQGWDSGHGAYSSQTHGVVGNLFIGKVTGANWVFSTYDSIYIQDSNLNTIGSNVIISVPANAYKWGFEVHETVASREGRDNVSGNAFGSTFSSGKWTSNTVTPSGFNVNQDGTNTSLISQPVIGNNDCYAGKNTTPTVECLIGLNSSNQTVIQGDTGQKIIFVQGNPGSTEWQFGNGFSGPVGSNPIIPNSAGATTLGNAGTPFSALYLGPTANSYGFIPATAAAARTINIPDPLQTTTTLPLTIASGTLALNTASVTTATCDGGKTATATGTLSTDTIMWSFNAAPTATNKYGAFLVVYAVPSANTVTFYTCNPSATTSTPTAMTVNWSVRRP